jgi:N-acetylglutamate synthase-like GNAT family acetyltransferase
MEIKYSFTKKPTTIQIIKLYDKSGLGRPTTNEQRLKEMFDNSNLIVTAWYNKTLVGVSRSITDWFWCCYLSDLAIDPDYKKSGIGKQLVNLTREKLGDECMLLLLSVPTAFDYYPKIGFEKEDRAFMIPRKK